MEAYKDYVFKEHINYVYYLYLYNIKMQNETTIVMHRGTMCPHSFYYHPIEMLFFSIQIIHVPDKFIVPPSCGELPACVPDMQMLS